MQNNRISNFSNSILHVNHGCNSEGDTLPDLKENLEEALYVYLDEPPGINMTFPLPDDTLSESDDIISYLIVNSLHQ